MKYLVELKNYDGQYVVSSRIIANELGKRHSNVVRDIENLFSSNLRILKNKSAEILVDLKKLIILNNYKDSKNRTYKEYLLTKDGFTLYMFNIQGYNDFKMAYINEFNRMEEILNNQILPFKKEKYVEVVDKIPREELLSMRKMIEMLTQKIEEDIKGIQNILGRIEDHKTHISAYSSILKRI